MKTREFNGITFEEVTGKKAIESMMQTYKYSIRKGYTDIFDVYDRPSKAKREIWRQWGKK